ncbi:zinc-binding alcohol dehydrogenase [Saccharothrix sp. AJ9571]|nr:zinc-binding alcohol dehydrogenase [Saccharothrix sp. AJ9571]
MPSERLLVIERPGEVSLQPMEQPDRPEEGTFDVEAVYSGLSAGTELSFVKGTHPHLKNGWDGELGLFGEGPAHTGFPVRQWGYMQVGRIVASRVPAFAEGTLVAMTYGHRSHHRADPLAERVVPLPAGLDPLLGIYVAHMGPICANGLLHAAAELHGTGARSLGDGVAGLRVAVTGAGVVGLLTALFARHHGAAEVVVVDPTPQRRQAAENLGFATLDPSDGDTPTRMKTRWRHRPGDRGADLVFQCRGQADTLGLALRLLRPQGTVIDLAFYQSGADALRLGEEFHHNGLGLRCAQIGRMPRGLAHLWDRERLSAETIALLRAEGPAIREHLVSDLVPFEKAPELFADLADRRRHVLQAVFTFSASA